MTMDSAQIGYKNFYKLRSDVGDQRLHLPHRGLLRLAAEHLWFVGPIPKPHQMQLQKHWKQYRSDYRRATKAAAWQDVSEK